MMRVAATGAFGAPGLYTKDSYSKLIAKGILPCVATRRDHSLVMLGRMNPGDLAKVASNARISPNARSVARKMLDSPALRGQVSKLALQEKAVEAKASEVERLKAAAEAAAAKEVTMEVSQAESERNLQNLDALFSP